MALKTSQTDNFTASGPTNSPWTELDCCLLRQKYQILPSFRQGIFRIVHFMPLFITKEDPDTYGDSREYAGLTAGMPMLVKWEI